MKTRMARLAMGVLVAAAVVLGAGSAGAVHWDLGPSKDDWKMKYDVAVSAADADKLNVVFTLSDAGRLAPIYSATVVVFSPVEFDGGSTYELKAPIKFEITKDGGAIGKVQFDRRFGNRAKIRILTLHVDGKKHTDGARYYDIPLKKFLNKAT
jgi:hypothetical protein